MTGVKRYLSRAAIVFMMALAVAACSEDREQGEGALAFSTTFGTRSLAPADYSVNIGTARGYTHMFTNTTVPSELWLAAGSYFIEVEAGEFLPEPSWSEKPLYYKEKKNFTITAGGVTPLEVKCKPRNTTIAITFDPETAGKVLVDYSVTLYPDPQDNTKTVVIDSQNAGRKLHLMFADALVDVRWKFNAVHDGVDVEKEGTLASLQCGKEYSLDFKYSYTPKVGNFTFDITVDKTTKDIARDIVIFQRPRIVGVDPFNSIAPVAGHTLTITAASGNIGSLTFSGSVFGENYDVLTAGDLASFGIERRSITAGCELTLSQAFFDRVVGALSSPAPDCGFTIIATDDTPEARTNEVFFKIATASLNPLVTGNAWAKKVDVSGFAMQSGEVKFAYRKVDGEWSYTEPIAPQEGVYKTTIKGLTPETEYETRLCFNGVLTGTLGKFVTGDTPQLPNAGMEDSGLAGDLHYFYKNPADKFWDTGNEGSTKAGISVTTSSSDAHSGSRSARLASAKAAIMGIGKFAAGNIYSGNFAGVDGMGGKVRFGRPFTARPTALKVWFKATAGIVDYSDNAPLGNGQKDQYQIYIALADSGFPHEVNTNNRSTFINYATHPGIIAYGELASPNNVYEWTEAIIPIDYRSTTRIPNHIIVVASASRYGDYFTGSTASIMYVDDFELIYE